MRKLVIVESPSKSKTIKQYLGDQYEVLSSKGHIRDLSISNVGGLGLDIEHDFTPKYDVIKDKESIVKELRKAAKKVDEVYLATDPDREGEAISWHLSEVLLDTNKPMFRVIFNEVTKNAILEAFEKPRTIDLGLVSSQETRRILDRIIGFKLSKLLQNKIKSKSAGRVQSAALKILVEREKEIAAFDKEEYWNIVAEFDGFKANLTKLKNRKAKIPNEEKADQILAELTPDFVVSRVESKERKRDSKPPFTTSSLQQEASNKLNLSGQRTMMIAQKLYEGIDLDNETVGLITYMRTDSIRLSQSFVQPALQKISNEYGKEYVGKPKSAGQNKKTQDAHEAIRPTDIKYTPDFVKPYLNKDEYKLYTMIYKRAIASLMRPAVIMGIQVDLTNGKALFMATAQSLVFDGYLKLYHDYESIDLSTLPEMQLEQIKHALNVEKSQHFTQPPSRYTEAKLIKAMEDLGIGRPSTYSQTVTTLKKRKYVNIEEKKFVPTEQGKLTIEKLDAFFSDIINVSYTAEMENVLDEIAHDQANQTKVISDFYYSFIPMVEKANQEMEKMAPETTGETCPKCGSPMVIRQSRYGQFEACSGFPECKYIKQTEKPKRAAKGTGIACPKCGKGEIVEREATRGKNKGNSFYACNNFPKCKYIVSNQPINAQCPKCKGLLVQTENNGIQCDDQKQCGYKKD